VDEEITITTIDEMKEEKIEQTIESDKTDGEKSKRKIIKKKPKTGVEEKTKLKS